MNEFKEIKLYSSTPRAIKAVKKIRSIIEHLPVHWKFVIPKTVSIAVLDNPTARFNLPEHVFYYTGVKRSDAQVILSDSVIYVYFNPQISEKYFQCEFLTVLAYAMFLNPIFPHQVDFWVKSLNVGNKKYSSRARFVGGFPFFLSARSALQRQNQNLFNGILALEEKIYSMYKDKYLVSKAP